MKEDEVKSKTKESGKEGKRGEFRVRRIEIKKQDILIQKLENKKRGVMFVLS